MSRLPQNHSKYEIEVSTKFQLNSIEKNNKLFM